MKAVWVSVAVALASGSARAQVVELLSDLHPACQSLGCGGVQPTDFATTQQGYAVFPANDGRTGTELWRTDGTPQGTALLKELRAGAAGSDPRGFVAVGGVVYFSADDGQAGRELWRTDGTALGTQLVKDVQPGAASGLVRFVGTLGGRVVFSGDDGTGSEPWSSDGTSAGTTKLLDLTLVPQGSDPQGGIEVGGTLYFIATNGMGERVIFRSTGTGATETVRRLTCDPTRLFPVGAGGTPFYFNTTCNELWRFDGVVPLLVGAYRLDELVRLGSDTFYLGTGPSTYGLHRLDPMLFVPERLDFDDGFTGRPSNLRTVGGRLVFLKVGLGAFGRVWASDGTVAGTAPVATFPNDGLTDPDAALSVYGATLVWNGALAADRRVLYRSDLTDAGTFPVWEAPSSAFSRTSSRVVFDAGVLAFLSDGVLGLEPWFSDGTRTGTRLLADVSPANESGDPTGLTLTPLGLVLAANDALLGNEPFVSDGSDGGTRRLVDVRPGPAGSAPVRFFPSDAGVYFFVPEDGGGALYGYETSLTRVASLELDASVAVYQGALFTLQHAPTTGFELGVLRPGAPAAQVVDLSPGPSSSQPGAFLATRDGVYFAATGPRGRELYLTDGTDAGTYLLEDVCPLSCNADPVPLVEAPFGTLVAASSALEGRELYRASPTGVRQVVDLVPGPAGSDPQSAVVVGGRVFFTATRPSEGRELYVTDGVAVTLVEDLRTGANGGNPEQLTMLDATRIVFTADDGVTGRELWVSDGTNAGTYVLDDFRPGAQGSNPRVLAVRRGVAFFTLDDAQRGRELWRTNGTTTGTRFIADLVPGSAGADPTEGVWFANGLVLAGSTALQGRELYRVRDGTPPTVDGFVIGRQGENGWYTTDVETRFEVDDAEFFLDSAVGCSTRLFTTDTPDASVTCTATSPGGTREVTLRFRRDATPPVVPRILFPDAGQALTGQSSVLLGGTAEADTRLALAVEQGGQLSTPLCTTRADLDGGWRCTVPLGTLDAGAFVLFVESKDEAGNASRSLGWSFELDRADTRAPSVACPSDMFRGARADGTWPLDWTALVEDDRDPAPRLESVPAKGTGLPVGVSTVRLRATDASGNVGECTFQVIVAEASKPVEDAGFMPMVLPPKKPACGCAASEGLAVGAALLLVARRRRARSGR